MVSARIELEGEMIGAFDSLLHTKLDWDYLWLTACRHRIASLVFHQYLKGQLIALRDHQRGQMFQGYQQKWAWHRPISWLGL